MDFARVFVFTLILLSRQRVFVSSVSFNVFWDVPNLMLLGVKCTADVSLIDLALDLRKAPGYGDR